MRRHSRHFIAFLVLFFLPIGPSAAATEESMEMMLFAEIPAVGTLVQSQASKSPVSVTVIDGDKLRLTPARNLYDLLEIYVPGFQYMTHFDASHMGLRGQQVDRDYAFLMLVNGQVVNQKSHNGPITELENWDVNDIEKVEVIRGPGSVTYGPGAVAGVISITTKSALASEGTEVGVQYVGGYNSLGAHVSQALKSDDLAWYIYGSFTKTQGYINPSILAFAPISQEAIYAADASSAPLLDYYPDARNKPQVKVYTELSFLKEWKAWARYVNSGTTRIVTWTDEISRPASWFFKQRASDGSYENNPSTTVQQAILAFENDHDVSNTLNLKTTLMGTSIDNKRVDSGLWGKGNFVENYSETDVTLKSLLRYSPMDTLKTALGIEAGYSHLGMGWGETDKDAFIMDDGNAFVSRMDSPALAARSWYGADQVIPLTDYDMYNYALLAEASYSVTSQVDIIFSARADKARYEPVSLSPRLALIYDADAIGIFKLNVQRSVRDNTLLQQAVAQYQGKPEPDQEMYTGAELIYSGSFLKNLSHELSGYYSYSDLLGWNPSASVNQAPASVSRVGNLQVAGVELTLNYKTDDRNLEIGANHSFAKQVGFRLESGQSSSFISRSDSHDTDYGGIPRNSIGDDRMNWPNNQTKLYTIIKLTDQLTLLSDMRYIWGYEGAQNLLTAYERGAQGTPNQARVENNVAYLKSQGIFDAQYRFDLSLSYEVVKSLSLTVIGQNLIRATRQWRYVYFMEGGAALDEPTVVGLRATYKF